MKKFKTYFFAILFTNLGYSQALRIPNNSNIVSSIGQKLGITAIEIKYNSPGVKGREGKIWGTDVAYFGTQILGFGSNVPSPWRAGADECTTISFSTNVKVNGEELKAGKYALFMDLGPDETTLIFNTNTREWGSYFYDKSLDVLRVKTKQIKGLPNSTERLNYTFAKNDGTSLEISLNWEFWSIPFRIETDSKSNILNYLKSEMTGELGFDPPSLIQASEWCLQNNLNLEQAFQWISIATSPNLGGVENFRTLSIQSKISEKMGKNDQAKVLLTKAIALGSVFEIHQYGRELLASKKLEEAKAIFENNHKKFNRAWPTNGGLMRVYSAMGDVEKALKYAKLALDQAPDNLNKENLKKFIKTLSEGKQI